MPELFQTIAELCFRIEAADCLAQVREILRAAAEAFGASFFLFAMRSGKNVSPPLQIIVNSYPKRWQRRYDELGATAFDPVVATAMQFKGPFRWDGLHQDARQMELRRESVRCGMSYGFSCSDRGADASAAILSFCGDRPIAPEPGQWELAAVSISLLASATHKAMKRIVEARNGRNNTAGESLNFAERESLRMTAEGMTAAEVGNVLGVAARTARYYLDRAAEKLGVPTRKEAVTKALAEGIIDLRRFPNAGFGNGTEVHG